MTRIKPIESWIPGSDSTNSRGKTTSVKLEIKNKKEQTKMKIKLVPKQKQKEAADPNDIGHTKPPTTGRDAYANQSVYNTAAQG
jgi:hypothetical protein